MSSCSRREDTTSWRSAYWLSKRCWSVLMTARSFRMLSMTLLWAVMMRLCCAIVSVRLATSLANSLLEPSTLVSRSERTGLVPVGRAGASSCVTCGAAGWSLGWIARIAAVCLSSYANRRVAIRVLRDC
ncbi:hypothetical protein EJ04DRAFT_76632 [Polyplosphaeria fusca]|uniref:Uncharacterized protein n=1 Tax=Polyplosphaeria fusca TaxID=682080 RepID=A0A9P4QPL1_9PLEO|nr:hypothetical protein EJ04DRAFT_76632 [Polyplosphaeria fusca]